jgi:serine/threonine protein kinase/tetratricopeptide (TPR) repeat protein
MNADRGESYNIPGEKTGVPARETRACPVCGAKFCATRSREFCPVCMLSKAAADEVEFGELLVFEEPVQSSLAHTAPRFENYELATDEVGQPVELGRGAMGVTYKAFDVDLQCPVTLKVISERYLGDESARLRFLREARAAASVRHPNVASVFHLGRTGQSYFYTMEFVDGETLEQLTKRSGRLEVKLALEIATQVAAGLAEVHKQKLVHRDIKPSNIMVRVEDGSTVTAKIIDLGLAKPAPDAPAEAAISTPGSFAGTPAFASPEQFAGVGVDIRSDLYSLGLVLWEMVTGNPVFKGSPAEVMHQHLHIPIPLDLLVAVPQPVVILLEVLLEKDPGRRFQTPSELLTAIQTITEAMGARRRVTRQSLQKTPFPASGFGTRKSQSKLGPKKVSVARLPVTGSDVFGRKEDIAFLDDAWANTDVNVVTIVAWAGVGKSTLVNHWLRRMAAEQYRRAQLVFGWSFYRQGTRAETTSADEFLDAALTWFGDPDPQRGTAWEKGERLAKLVANRRTLLILDGLEPLQNPPGPGEGRVREPSLQALLRELAAFNTGLCVITTRLPVADLADHAATSARRRDLEQLSSDAGEQLLRALGVNGSELELRSATEEFSGHCLALTLLGSYLTDAFDGDIRFRKEVSQRLAHDVRQGTHARKAMESYQTWFGEGPELAVLRMLGLFDRPAEEKALGALLKPPAIPGLTEALTDLSPVEWRTILARLRRGRLLCGEDPHNPGHLDAHPLVREFFGGQLLSQQTDAWKECNRRLYYYYGTLAPQLPDTFREMEPLFLAVICGCNAGLFRETLREVYIPRIQRGNAYFAAEVLGARGPLLSVLIHFFKDERWGSFAETAIEGQSLDREDQLFILMQAASYLTSMRGLGAPEARNCYERAEPLCQSLGRPLLLCVTLIGQWRYALQTDRMSAAMQIAERVYSLAKEQDDAGLMIAAYRALSCTLHYLGDFESSRRYATRCIAIWRSGNVQSRTEDPYTPVVACMSYLSNTEWHLGEIASGQRTIAEAISLAKELNDMNALAIALSWAAGFAQCESDVGKVDRLASDLIELSTRHHFVFWMAIGSIYRGWARAVYGNTEEGIPWIEQGIRDSRATGAVLSLPYFLGLKAQALYLADRTSEALEAIKEAEKVADRYEQHVSRAELRRLRAVFLTAIGAEENRIEASFCEAIRTAKEQKSISLQKRAEGADAEYRRQKASSSGERRFRLPL